MGITADQAAAWLAEAAELRETFITALRAGLVAVGQTHDVGNGPLIVAQITVTGVVVLTTDGLPVATPLDWHRGPDPAGEDWVRYERWDVTGNHLAHGFIDPSSRQLLQAG